MRDQVTWASRFPRNLAEAVMERGVFGYAEMQGLAQKQGCLLEEKPSETMAKTDGGSAGRVRGTWRTHMDGRAQALTDRIYRILDCAVRVSRVFNRINR